MQALAAPQALAQAAAWLAPKDALPPVAVYRRRIALDGPLTLTDADRVPVCGPAASCGVDQ